MRSVYIIALIAATAGIAPTAAMAVTYSQVNATSSTVNGGVEINITATCPAGTWLTGGGYSLVPDGNGANPGAPRVPVVALSAPSPTSTGWQVIALLANRGRVIAVARCATP